VPPGSRNWASRSTGSGRSLDFRRCPGSFWMSPYGERASVHFRSISRPTPEGCRAAGASGTRRPPLASSSAAFCTGGARPARVRWASAWRGVAAAMAGASTARRAAVGRGAVAELPETKRMNPYVIGRVQVAETPKTKRMNPYTPGLPRLRGCASDGRAGMTVERG
jgi:hypothetical protein